MIKLIKLLLQFANFSKVMRTLLPKDIMGIFSKIMSGKNITGKALGKVSKELLNSLGVIKNELSQALAGINKLERLLKTNPKRAIEEITGTLNDKELRKLSNMLSTNNEGIQTFLSSSWIVWAIWVPTTPNQMFGTLTIKLKHGSEQNPSGIYTFPLHSHPHGYGAWVPRYVYEALKSSASAGTTFWEVFYRRWYNYHRKIHYNLLPFDNDWKKARQYTNYRKK